MLRQTSHAFWPHARAVCRAEVRWRGYLTKCEARHIAGRPRADGAVWGSGSGVLVGENKGSPVEEDWRTMRAIAYVAEKILN